MMDLAPVRIMTPPCWRRIAYGLLTVAIAGSIGFEFRDARQREPAPGWAHLPLVTRERALAAGDGWEVRARRGISVLVQGLSATEMLLDERDLWRHALAPATVITVMRREQAGRIKFVFDNARHDQVMTIRVGGREMERRGPLPEGRVAGEVALPAAAEELSVEFAFSRWEQPPPDSRKITVTFRELTLILP
jgi:hypothetical protein